MLFSCNFESLDSADLKKIQEESLLEDKDFSLQEIEKLYNEELKFVDEESEEYIVINIGSNTKKNLDYYLSAYTINLFVQGKSFSLDNVKHQTKKSNTDLLHLIDSFDKVENEFDIRIINSSPNLEEKSISFSIEPVSNEYSELQFPQSFTEFTSPSRHRWGRVNRFLIFGSPELNEPNSNPGYFIVYPVKRTCGLCLWNQDWDQTKPFPNVGDQLIYGNDNWVQVRFRIRHDANTFFVYFKRMASDPW
jgi:hypothetical protein